MVSARNRCFGVDRTGNDPIRDVFTICGDTGRVRQPYRCLVLLSKWGGTGNAASVVSGGAAGSKGEALGIHPGRRQRRNGI